MMIATHHLSIIIHHLLLHVHRHHKQTDFHIFRIAKDFPSDVGTCVSGGINIIYQ